MDEDLILQQPIDRRLDNANIKNLPPGPPGVEIDASEYERSASIKISEKDTSSKVSRRRASSSRSPSPRKRLSASDSRQSSASTSRRCRSPYPRRNRFRESSPDRRRYAGDNWYRPKQRGRDRSRDRSRERSRDRSRDRHRSHERERDRRSTSPRNRLNYRDERQRQKNFSPRPNKGLIPTKSDAIGPALQQQLPHQALPQVSNDSSANAQYVILPAALYGDSFGTSTMYNQYNLPPPVRPTYVATGENYMPTNTVQQFNSNYPPQNVWSGTDTYTAQPWIQHAVSEPAMQTVSATAPATIVAASGNLSVPEVATVTQQVKNVTPNDAVAMEAENHRGELKKQRIGYQRKMRMLVNELNVLRQKHQIINGDKSSNLPPNSEDHVSDIGKSQKQIERKIGAIENVIDMLTNIIGDRAEFEQKHGRERIGYSNNFNTSVTISKHESHKDILERFKKALRATISHSDGEEKSDGDDNDDMDSDSSVSSSSSGSSSSSTSSNSSIFNTKNNIRNNNKKALKTINAELARHEEDDEDSSSERLKTKAIESMRSKKAAVAAAASRVRERVRDTDKTRFNFTFYDPETHWCRTCNAFPKTARDYLNHLHTTEHIQREMIETPWHEIMPHDDFPEYENATTKRVPIRGIMFFSPASSWFCKLCKIWIGDLHCASVHLKSQTHYYKYNEYISENPDFEVNWEADRLRKHGETLSAPLIAAVQPAENDNTISSSKVVTAPSPDLGYVHSVDMRGKSYKNIDKRMNKNDSTSDSNLSDSDDNQPKSTSAKADNIEKPYVGTGLKHAVVRKQIQTVIEQDQEADSTVAPPPPPRISGPHLQKVTSADAHSSSEESDNGNAHRNLKYQAKLVSKYISTKEQTVKTPSQKNVLAEPKYKTSKSEIAETNTARKRERSKSDNEDQIVNETQSNRRAKRNDSSERRRRVRSRTRSRDRRRTHSRSRSISRSRYRGRERRSRSRGRRSISRGRASGWNRRRGAYRRSRSLRRRSRTPVRRRRLSRSRSRSRSRSNTYSRSPSPTPRRIEKPIVKHSEFRPRVPPESSKKKLSNNESKEKNDAIKKISVTAGNLTGTNSKKLPFIGKMPVFKKQTNSNGCQEFVAGQEKDSDDNLQNMKYTSSALQRQHAPTAAQIQMAMMEDAYGNAPPFHPDAGVGMTMDYDDLMPDPVEFVNLMGPVPPPPPADMKENTEVESDSDILPPGIDQMDNDEFVVAAKPPNECEIEDKSNLPKDFEEALNIIFPGQKKPEEEENKKNQLNSTETQIIVDEPVMQAADLVKEGIHLVTSDDINIIAMDDASQISMNEPLIFHQRNVKPRTSITIKENNEEEFNQTANSASSAITAKLKETTPQINEIQLDCEGKNIVTTIATPEEIPMPEDQSELINAIVQEEVISTASMAYNLEDIPRPPPSPTESEKNRRQEALDDLAMLGIDADDMAAQCM